MNKPTKKVLLIIGIITTLSGVLSYFRQDDTLISIMGVFLGISLIGSVFLPKQK